MNELGRLAEDRAAAYLKALGYKILAMRWSCPMGELDIVALDGGTMVFAEVKARSSFAYGFPAEMVGRRKRARIVKAALSYIKAVNARPEAVRFDVIGFGQG
ncbi:MAG TPA: YraN family protein, partial [Elusimicrobiales bacterium]|nr:YraN family protein [Elusimicrobiales bacterium]